MPVETEIKLRLPDGAVHARELLEHLGFTELSPRQLEVDQVFDLPGQTLRRSGRLLRLRHRGGQWTLTYKGPAGPGRHKSRDETETDIAEGAAFEAILEALGYERTFRYEKYRTKFIAADKKGSGIVTLDETPIGSFLELEGPAYWIDETAAHLGFGQEQYITSSYATLYQEHLSASAGGPVNMTF
jgi:adenylate cyclase class 2